MKLCCSHQDVHWQSKVWTHTSDLMVLSKQQAAIFTDEHKTEGMTCTFFPSFSLHPGSERVHTLLPPAHQPPVRPGGRGGGEERPWVCSPSLYIALAEEFQLRNLVGFLPCNSSE